VCGLVVRDVVWMRLRARESVQELERYVTLHRCVVGSEKKLPGSLTCKSLRNRYCPNYYSSYTQQ
jgi:hypothetical protein